MRKLFLTHQRLYTIATIGYVITILLVMLFGYWKIQTDDSYIYYSYASNLANGDGYVFNIGEKINATTSPLYTVILAISTWILQYFHFFKIPLIGHLIGITSLFFICLFFMEIFKTEEFHLFPFVLPLCFLLSPLLPNAVGMETFLAMMLAMMCLYLYWRGKLLAASLVCSFAVLARPDMLLLGIVIVVYDLIRNHRFPTLSMSLSFVIPILVWLLFNYFYFGNILPTSLIGKLSQTQSGRWGSGLIFLKGLISTPVWHSNTFRVAVFSAGLCGLVILGIKYKKWGVLQHPILHIILLWNVVYLTIYGFILNPPSYYWYYTPLALGFALLMTLPIEAIYRFISKKTRINKTVTISLLSSYLLLICLQLPVFFLIGSVTGKYENNKFAAEWLNDNVRTGSSVGAYEIGVLRYYYKNGPIIDGAGLVTPEVAEHLGQHDYSWFILSYSPDYLVFNYPNRPKLESMVDADWFQEDYSLLTILDVPNGQFAIYERQN